MKFKIPRGTDTFDRLMVLRTRIHAADEAAATLAEAHGMPLISGGFDCLGGGIKGFKLDVKPANFRCVAPGWYYPMETRVATRALVKAIHALPRVKRHVLAELLDYAPQTVRTPFGDKYSTHPGVIFGPEQCLLDVLEGAVFTPSGDLTEILESEYLALSAAKSITHA
jgi:hypothetical protein